MININLTNLLMAIAVGGIVGFVNEYRKISGARLFLGLRTAIFISLLGYMFSIFTLLFPGYIALLSAIITITTISTSIYLEKVKATGSPGGTTYVSIFLVFFSGLLEGLGYYELGVIISVLVAALGIYKTQLLDAISKIRKEELLAILNLMILSLVILPLLPNKNIGPYGIFNPFQFWLIVVVIGIIFVAQYIVLKIYKKGLIAFSIIGGLVSSTTVTLSLIELSNKEKNIGKTIAYNIILSNIPLVLVQALAFSYFSTYSSKLIYYITPSILVLILALIIIGSIGYKHITVSGIPSPETPLPIGKVIEFGVVFFIVMIISKLVSILVSYLLPLALFVSSFANVAGVVFSIALLYIHGQINAKYAAYLIQLALIAGIIEKGFLAFLSKDKEVRNLTLILSLILIGILILMMFI
ncbi:putative membrane protein [Caldisphaera lagunensis DSM 15908]|uniref:Putative membrane protein n=1 Tax=Caldisphaera lagunensis (strain DSM 15908 / JCM 11604 / ANMR 0165 / IC-154) TaxID=1056495 RepID=L0ADH2_CALLD|nr:MgtC/SapB family protein [Caldisphaera lagunensis]AFZ71172.1 putative membrane protein [Caldisphaera lagunensis DSM 15908]